MKILEVINIGYEAGGAEKSVKLIADNLKGKGHQVKVVSTDTNAEGKKLFADEVLPAINGSAITRLFRYLWFRQTYKKVRDIISEFEPDLVHLHTICEFSPSLLWALGKTPAIITIHGPEDYTLKLLPWDLPSSDYINNSYQWKDIKKVGRLRYCYLRFIQRPAYLLGLKRVKLVLAPSKFIQKALEADFPDDKIHQLYNGIDLPPAIDLPETGSKTILYVGRLETVKGVNYLVQAFSEIQKTVPSAKLRIVGDGNQMSELKKLSKQLGLEKSIDFAGWVPQTDIFKEYANADILVIPSVWPENLPTVAIEALASGRPIIGTRVGGVPELVEDKVTGFIVSPGDAPELASAVTRILSDDKLLKSASTKSIKKSREFSSDIFIDKLTAIYEGVINENSGS